MSIPVQPTDSDEVLGAVVDLAASLRARLATAEAALADRDRHFMWDERLRMEREAGDLATRLATAEAERDRLRGAASDAAAALEEESRWADHRADDMAEEYEIGPAYHAERERAHRYLAIACKLRTPAPSTGTTPP